MKRALLLLAITAVVVFATIGGAWFWNAPKWPQFADAASEEPQVIVQADRDYAYHLADLITVEIFIKQNKGIEIDPLSLTVGGDFELNTKPESARKSLDDGSVIHRIRLKIQALKVKPEWVLNASIAYKSGEKRRDLSIPKQSFFWSNTYDGRESLQEGDSARTLAYYSFARFIVPLVLSSLAFLSLCGLALRNFIRSRPVVVPDFSKQRISELLDLISRGACSKEQHLELDSLVRERFKLGPIPASQLKADLIGTLQAKTLVEFLKINAPAIYARDGLNEPDRVRLNQLGKQLLKSWR